MPPSIFPFIKRNRLGHRPAQCQMRRLHAAISEIGGSVVTRASVTPVLDIEPKRVAEHKLPKLTGIIILCGVDCFVIQRKSTSTEAVYSVSALSLIHI